MKTNRELKQIAVAAIESEYSFAPTQKQVMLLESSGDGAYILFRVGKHEYRFDSRVMVDGSVWVGSGTLEIVK